VPAEFNYRNNERIGKLRTKNCLGCIFNRFLHAIISAPIVAIGHEGYRLVVRLFYIDQFSNKKTFKYESKIATRNVFLTKTELVGRSFLKGITLSNFNAFCCS
jgi:hypothetical protein